MPDVSNVGARFSQVYIDPGKTALDSQRARVRIASALCEYCSEIDLAAKLTSELGLKITRLHYSYEFIAFFQNAELRDVLDAITVAAHSLDQRERANALYGTRSASKVPRMLQTISRIFREENLGYVLDERAGVRHHVDAEFARNQTSVIAALSQERHKATVQYFERAHADLDSTPPDTRNAVRHVLDAVENQFKNMFAVTRLDPSALKKKLGPLVAAKYSGQAQACATQQLEAFGNWVTSVYQYRHADGANEFEPPPLSLAVAILSSGAAHLRWLAEFE